MKNFRVNLIFRILLLTASIYFFIYLLQNSYLTASIVIVGFVCLIQIYFIIKFVDETNREISNFLFSIKYSDFSQSFSKQYLGKSFKELNNSFNEVIQKFKKTRSEKEEQYRYLNTVMQHIGVGLLSFDQDGKVEFINNAAKRLLKIKYLTNVKSLDRVQKGLSNELTNIRQGNKHILKITDENDIVQLIINSTELKMRGKRFKLISLQNIHSELEDKEIDAWQKLIRVLTHEIMNSVTPISSLAATVNDILTNTPKETKLDDENLSDITSAVNTIHKRSEGLIHFVNDYRSLTKTPKPNFQIIKIKDIFDRISELLDSDLTSRNINLTTRVNPETLEITCDPDLIEQVLINLIVNAKHALGETRNPEINLYAGVDPRGKFIMKVIDNGPGLNEDVIDKIFIPFFSTKKEGSGIGLSLSKQIIKNHNGTIAVKSKPNEETVFTIKF
ncbi:MAG: ATP-binding protein [Melioribacteraceae bacterium]|nr:ATP-binding protein [Melioribacteraceae bacterium]